MTKNPIFSYTKRDYEGARKEGLAQIPRISKGQWTDLNASDPGVIILDYVHALVDMINYYQDHQALEVFMPTAKERANIFRLAKQLSYKVKSAKGASCIVEFRSFLVFDFPIKIPKYTKLSTNTGINYLTTEDAYLPAKSDRVSVPCTQGTLVEVPYRGTGVSRFSEGERRFNQALVLSYKNIDTDTITVVDNSGEEWKLVDHIVFADSDEKSYQIDINPDDSIVIRFGDGERGRVPSTSDLLTVRFLSSDAEEGRISANTLVNLDSTIFDKEVGGRYVAFSVTNPDSSVGGSSIQSSQDIRDFAINSVKSQDRAITLEDYENLARSVEGVLDAKAHDINSNPDICLYHEVKLLISPIDRDNPERVAKEVYEYISKRMIPPTNLQVIIPSYQSIDLNITVQRFSNISVETLYYSVRQAVIEYFEKNMKDIGVSFNPLDLSASLSTVDGVKSIISISPNRTVSASSLSSIVLGNLDINVRN